MRKKEISSIIHWKSIKKLLIVMKLSTILIFVTSLQLSASIYSQEARVNMKIASGTIADVFKAIEKQSDFRVFYNLSQIDLSTPVSYTTSQAKPITEVLGDVLNKIGVSYELYDKVIVIVPASARQNHKISGTVVDAATGEALPGVNILVEGTTVGTVTDARGKYTIELSPANAVLVFSFLGYLSEKVESGRQTILDIKLSPNIQKLDEVVVIGYQTIRKKDLTGAVTVVSPDASSRVSSNSLSESIQGLAAGVSVRNSGATGGASKIEIRGVASYTNSDPLYVIDGMIADANLTVNMDDIESLQILKDASASAIYGSRAANGVIIITTKQGKEGPMKVSFSTKVGVQQIPKRWNIMNNTEFSAMQKTQYENSGVIAPTSITTNFDPSVNTNWQDEVLRNGVMQNYNLTLSGGSKTSSYLVSGSYYDNDNYVIDNSFKRASLRVNTQGERGRFRFGENLMLSNSVEKYPGNGNVIYDMAEMLPIIPVQADKYISTTNPRGFGIGTTDAVTYAYNPIAVNSLSHTTPNYSKMIGNMFGEFWIATRIPTSVKISVHGPLTIPEPRIPELVWQPTTRVL
jgi:TonB-dependent starch-binding outer membrane protein SusC